MGSGTLQRRTHVGRSEQAREPSDRGSTRSTVVARAVESLVVRTHDGREARRAPRSA